MTHSANDPLRLLKSRWAIAAVVLLVALVGVRRMTAPTEVRTVTLERRDIVETLAVVGRVRAPSRAGLGASIAGTVTNVEVREGDRVSRGEVLVALDDREAAAAVRQAEAALAETRASTDHAIAEAEREAIQSARDLERIRAVVEEGAFNSQRLEQAEQRAADAASRLESLRATMGSDGEAASIARARASLETARARLDLTRITAPADGDEHAFDERAAQQRQTGGGSAGGRGLSPLQRRRDPGQIAAGAVCSPSDHSATTQ